MVIKVLLLTTQPSTMDDVRTCHCLVRETQADLQDQR
jgi:hypothetical protein